MAIDLSTRICDSCALATVCPHREMFLAFYEHRNELLVKTGVDGEGNADTSEKVSIRVEHRYINGPALEQLYRELGLSGVLDDGSNPCCGAPFAGCPLMTHPFDSPVFHRYPHAVGYIEPLCHSARDIKGNRIPFKAPFTPPRTNEVHAKPFLSYMGNRWWKCGTCARSGSCSVAGMNDYAKLGGTIYSTFKVDNIDTSVGSQIATEDVAVPSNIMANYQRMENTPSHFLVTSEEDVFVIYYEYVEPETSNTDSKPQWMTLKDIEDAGLTHIAEAFFRDKSFIYPSKGLDVPMEVSLDSLICGPINRMSEDGHVVAVSGDYIPFTLVDDEYKALYSTEDKPLYTSEEELIGTYGGQLLSITEETLKLAQRDPTKATAIDCSLGNYRKLSVVEGDRIGITIKFDAKYKLDCSMMRLMNYGVDLQLFATDMVINDERITHLIVEVPNRDFVIQFCLVEAAKSSDPVTYRPIDYLSMWDPMSIGFNYKQTTARNHNRLVSVMQPIAPRKWPAGMIADRTPEYEEDCPPSDSQLVRPLFHLKGYVDDGYGRIRFSPYLNIVPAYTLTYPRELRFLTTGTPADHVYWAMWEINYDQLNEMIMDVLKPAGLTPTDTESLIQVETTIGKDHSSTVSDTMDKTYPVIELEWSLPYDPDNPTKVLQTFSNLGSTDLMLDAFHFKIIELPKGYQRAFTIHNNHGDDEYSSNGHMPTATVRWTPDGIGMEASLDSLEVTLEDDFSLGITNELLLLVYPKNFGGLYIYDQSFIAYHITVKQEPQKVDVTFIFDGEYMELKQGINNPWDCGCSCTDGNMALFDMKYTKGYILNGVFPEDGADVTLVHEDNIIQLGGAKADFYRLSPYCDIEYRQTINVRSFMANGKPVDEQEFTVDYKGFCELEFKAPEGESILSIVANGQPLMAIADNARQLNNITSDDFKATITMEGDTYKITFLSIAKDIDIEIIRGYGSDGSIEGCARCRDYVDGHPNDFIDWYPVCNLYLSNE